MRWGREKEESIGIKRKKYQKGMERKDKEEGF